MEKVLRKIYLKSPFFIKRAFANAEAIRRNIYRRSGQYEQHYKNLDVSKMLKNYNTMDHIYKMNTLIKHVKHNIPYYQENLKSDCIQSLNDFEKLPLTSKSLIRNNIKDLVDEKSVKQLWSGSTSGSTGTPLNYYRDKNSMQFEYALYDRLYDYLAGSIKPTKARISGVNIVKAENNKPPFWYFIKVFNQLQLSAYHIDSRTYKLYLKALSTYKIKLGTGYASSWLFLSQYILESDKNAPKLSGIITDSEGFSNEDKLKVEKAFNTPVYQTYGLGEVGMLAVQCRNNHYHMFTDRCFIEVVDENENVVDDGEEGELVVTDLHSFNAPFIRYKTGDRGILDRRECGCGWKTPYIKALEGRMDDYILTSTGKKIGRLSHIAKPAVGVLNIQLVQKKIGYLEIRVLPSENFEQKSMEKVMEVAKDYLGDMNITWNIVKELEKTQRGKTRYVIRSI